MLPKLGSSRALEVLCFSVGLMGGPLSFRSHFAVIRSTASFDGFSMADWSCGSAVVHDRLELWFLRMADSSCGIHVIRSTASLWVRVHVFFHGRARVHGQWKRWGIGDRWYPDTKRAPAPRVAFHIRWFDFGKAKASSGGRPRWGVVATTARSPPLCREALAMEPVGVTGNSVRRRTESRNGYWPIYLP